MDKVFDVVQDFATYFLNIFSRDNTLSKNEILQKIIEYFE